MSQQLQIWAEKVMRQVDEGTPAARRIRLTGEGQVFETWEPVMGMNPAEWYAEAEQLVSMLTEELPKRRCQLTFTAEDNAGATLSQSFKTVTGKNQAVQDLGTQNGAKALADALASVAKTMESTLAQARGMMEFQAAQLAKAYEQNQEFIELFQAMQKLELESGEQDSVASRVLVEQIQQASPLLMQLVQHWMTSSEKKGLGGVAAAAAAATTNGVKAS